MKIKATGHYLVMVADEQGVRRTVSTHKDLSNAHAAAANILLAGNATQVAITCAITVTLAGRKK